MKPASSPLLALLQSRKGILTFQVFLMSTGIEIAILVAAFRGSITIDKAILYSFGSLFAATAGALATIHGIAREDAAKASKTKDKENS